MKKRIFVSVILGWLVFSPGRAPAQFTPQELAERDKWEDFLNTAEIIGEEQIRGDIAVTSPWKLALKKDDVVRNALWKNPEGRLAGYWEGWKYEIAAYRLDKHLGLNMVPPTIERRFRGNRGSLQLWIDGCLTLRQKNEKKIRTPSLRIFNWNRSTYIQRAWDNLIANLDRHMNQVLITEDFRMILIDHSRAFRSSKKFTRELLYSEKSREGPKLMSELPRAFVEKIKVLTFDGIKSVVGDCLTDEEIRAVLARRDLILAEIDRLIKKSSEATVLY